MKKLENVGAKLTTPLLVRVALVFGVMLLVSCVTPPRKEPSAVTITPVSGTLSFEVFLPVKSEFRVIFNYVKKGKLLADQRGHAYRATMHPGTHRIHLEMFARSKGHGLKVNIPSTGNSANLAVRFPEAQMMGTHKWRDTKEPILIGMGSTEKISAAKVFDLASELAKHESACVIYIQIIEVGKAPPKRHPKLSVYTYPTLVPPAVPYCGLVKTRLA
jgi:hypothetical protein